ncbi:MAG: 50S ribosomal protein L3 [Candidatus Parcubacteria bacterium]|nr:MAG: 50S ribosomal protein L3 [Candidatus Parcubacteria bacterium]
MADSIRDKFLLGEKVGMTQIFKDEKTLPVTVIKAGPCQVVDLKTKERNGYSAVVLSFLIKDRKKILKEFRLKEDTDIFKIGDTLDVNIFQVGDKVKIRARRKAKGFSGVVKRHGFAGGPKTHGQEDTHRHGGSIGQKWPQRVRKGLKMAGRIAPNYVTVKNLKVIDILAENNIILVKGSIPGPNHSLVEIKG